MTTKMRIFHGPVNIAGIGRHLADWQRKWGADADFIVFDVPERKANKNHHFYGIYQQHGGAILGLSENRCPIDPRIGPVGGPQVFEADIRSRSYTRSGWTARVRVLLGSLVWL